jgi:hypothetical protein
MIFWNCTSGWTSACLTIDGGSNWTIAINNRINYSSYYGIYIDASHNLFKNMNITNIASYSVYMPSTTDRNNTFINVSFDNQTLGGEVIRKWYYKAYINWSTGGTVNSGYLWAFNRTNGLEFNVTISSGTIEMQEITDYISLYEIGTTYYSPYNITAYTTTNQTSHSFNASLGNNLTDYFVLQSPDTCIPPAINNNWNVLCSDFCNITSNVNLGIGNLTIAGNGTFNLAAIASVHHFVFYEPDSGKCNFINFEKLRII